MRGGVMALAHIIRSPYSLYNIRIKMIFLFFIESSLLINFLLCHEFVAALTNKYQQYTLVTE